MSQIPLDNISWAADINTMMGELYGGLITTNVQSGTSYQLVLSDAGKEVRMTNAAANSVTIPASATVAIPVGYSIVVTQAGVGATTIVAAVGVTINQPSGASLRLAGINAQVLLRKLATDNWEIIGALAITALTLGIGDTTALQIAAAPATGATAGGGFTVQAGQGGPTNQGGALTLRGGPGGVTSGPGGTVSISGGVATDGTGGAAIVVGANGATTSGANRNGGVALLAGGTAVQAGIGGSATVQGGAGPSGTGGDAVVRAGNGGTNGTVKLQIGINVKCQVDGNGNFIHKNAVADQSYSLQVPTTGFAITVPNNVSQLILNPAGTLASGTVTMPANPIDGQELGVASTQTITALTVSPNTGQSVSGAPTTIGPASPATFKYLLGAAIWIRC